MSLASIYSEYVLTKEWENPVYKGLCFHFEESPVT